MSNRAFPLEETSIGGLFFSHERMTFEVPIYQRNYAWGVDEIEALVQDVYDAFSAGKETYFIGTLVTFHKGKRVFEVIDGQQRLTTLYIALRALGEFPTNELTYSSRKRSTDTISELGRPDAGRAANVDAGIAGGYETACKAIGDLVPESELARFHEYFKERVHIIFYQVPKDIDLNHYFEVMNSRGEQLEQHEVVKAIMLSKLDDAADRAKFNRIWEQCSEMDRYVQQVINSASSDISKEIFGAGRNVFLPNTFDELPPVDADGDNGLKSIRDLIQSKEGDEMPGNGAKAGVRFQPIIDFPNFLLIVLKLTRLGEPGFDPAGFTLDDKEIIRQFDSALSARTQSLRADAEFVKQFGYNLLLSKFFLDNYVVHHTLEDDRPGDNPWKLQCWEWHANESGDKGYPSNLFPDAREQRASEHLLSMFEVSFTARQRKNYLLYCMLYLHAHKGNPRDGYLRFLSDLARTYLRDVYLGPAEGLNDKNTPKPGSFDAVVLEAIPGSAELAFRLRDLSSSPLVDEASVRETAQERFGDGKDASRGIPLFVFNYLDYLLWEDYFDNVRGYNKREDVPRRAFFDRLGCSDFGLDVFKDFYFSRARRSLEHFYSQALQVRNSDSGGLTKAQINCLGNFAMIGHDMNSSGSDWSPKVKLDHYLDTSGKINRVSVASLKFMVMMQVCKDNAATCVSGQEWVFEDIDRHQKAMINYLVSGSDSKPSI